MNITLAAIEKNRITVVALIVIFFAGLAAYRDMPQSEDPGFIIRVALVVTYFPGASPERVEQLVTDRLEKAIQEIPELDFISSESKTGVSLIYVNIKESYTEMRPIWDDLRRKVDRVRADLPNGVIGPIVNDEFGDVFGIIIALTGEGYTYAELKEVADDVRNELLLIDEAAKVEIQGAQEERVFVEYNNARLAEFGLSPLQLAQILDTHNIIIPGGDVTTEAERIVLEPTGNFESLEDLRRSVIKLPGRQDLLYLEDLANVYRDYIDPPESMMRYSGRPCLGLAVSLRKGGNILSLGRQVKAAIDRLQEVYPIGIEFEIVAFQPDHVSRKVDSFVASLFQAVAIVLGVMLATLGVRTGFVVASLIPMSMVMSLLVMSILDIGIDQMSLAALIIALGMLVDNAIVMSESIMVQIAEGKSPVQAAVDSGIELRIPLLTSSLTTAAAFLPIYLAESSTGEYTAPLFKVVTIALLSSWVLSLTMTPLLCVTFLRVRAAGPAEEGLYASRFFRAYRALLLVGLRHRFAALGAALLIFLVAMQGFRFIPNIFFPPNDKAILKAEFDLPMGTPIEKTLEVVAEIEAFLEEKLSVAPDRPEGILNWATFIGQGAPRFVLNFNPEQARPEYAVMIVNATSVRAIQETILPAMEAFSLENFPDLSANIMLLPTGPPPTAPVEVRISGKDPDALFRIADAVKEKLASIPGTKNMEDDWGLRTKKLRVNVNQPRARRAGLTNADVALSLQTVLSGYESTQYREEDEVIPIILRSAGADRKDIGKLETLNIYAQSTGQSVPLKQVADVEVVWQPSKILRRDTLRTVTVECDIEPSTTPIAVSNAMDAWLKGESAGWEAGYKYELGGELEKSVEANKSIADKVPVAGFIILFILVAQFNSIRRPLIILVTIPLGMIGVVFGLIAAGSYFGFMTLLGIISLSGIVINNAIVLIDRIRIEIEENRLEPPRAVIEAAQRRLRPILLTTLTTIGGLVPLWFGGGPMWEPMAISIIFGLLFATVLTLGLVPILYSLLFRVPFRDFRY
jgi:multidrug efflux pump subunit AcrB